MQELANTLDIETGQDALTAPRGLAVFAREHGLTGLGLTKRDLPQLMELREALRAACLAHTGPELPAATARDLERLLSGAPLVLHLNGEGAALLRPAPGLTGVPGLTARVAAGIATAGGDGATGDGSWQRLKACEAHDCRWVFYDRSPAGRGRWCTMALCGSRAKMRTYRARRPAP